MIKVRFRFLEITNISPDLKTPTIQIVLINNQQIETGKSWEIDLEGENFIEDELTLYVFHFLLNHSET